MMLLLFLSLMVSTIQAFRMSQIHQFASPRLVKEVNKLSMSLVQADWESPRVSVLTEIEDYPGSLHDILKYFWKHDINLTHIESRPSPKNSNGFHIYIDFHGYRGDPKTDSLMQDLQHKCKNMLVLDEREVPWFPRHISELDKIAIRVLDAGSELQCDHPGFHDVEYRERRTRLAQLADRHKYGEEVPYINYTSDEVKTWGIVYAKLKSLQEQYACPEYLKILPILEKECGYSTNNIPQVRDISKFLQSKTGFQIRPVSGLLSSRDFLSGLAFRVFFSTQYIRHSSKPLYTPEPDICHELIGHAPMFADQDFADFSQEIGLASLGASDEDVKRLATCYWHSVEFGLVKSQAKDGKVKAYGAGLLSSFGELEYSCSKTTFPVPAGDANQPQPDKPRLLPWDPKVASTTDYPITSYQPTYFVAESLSDTKQQMRKFCEQLPKPFNAKYNTLTNSIWVDRAVKIDEINYEEKHKIKYSF